MWDGAACIAYRLFSLFSVDRTSHPYSSHTIYNHLNTTYTSIDIDTTLQDWWRHSFFRWVHSIQLRPSSKLAFITKNLYNKLASNFLTIIGVTFELFELYYCFDFFLNFTLKALKLIMFIFNDHCKSANNDGLYELKLKSYSTQQQHAID